MSSPTADPFSLIQKKMQAADVAQPAIRAFVDAVGRLREGESGLLPESEIEPVQEVLDYSSLPSDDASGQLFEQLAVIKLNGGLGTGMGLAGPKSLLPVRGNDTFLDFIARQVLRLRDQAGSRRPVFLLMNSFNTREETLNYLRKYPRLSNDDDTLDFVQNKVPKLDPDTLTPVTWNDAPDLEWCPPGHGDLYVSLVGNHRLLDRLLDAGIRFLFVSNSDNLGSTADGRILNHFARSHQGFLMEVAARTEVDRKGGHLARRKSDGRLVLRESAQCPSEDLSQFQDVARHRFFNTNNLWIQLEHLRDALKAHDGVLPLPLIQNRKSVNPQQPGSREVLQLESAMGAAIECFERSSALLVPRTRFAPVKTTSDLLGVRSDAYETRENQTVLRLVDARQGRPPQIHLDPTHFKLLDSFESFFPEGTPSLIDCRSLNVKGPVQFAANVRICGDVSIVNASPESKTIPAGTYADQTVELR